MRAALEVSSTIVLFSVNVTITVRERIFIIAEVVMVLMHILRILFCTALRSASSSSMSQTPFLHGFSFCIAYVLTFPGSIISCKPSINWRTGLFEGTTPIGRLLQHLMSQVFVSVAGREHSKTWSKPRLVSQIHETEIRSDSHLQRLQTWPKCRSRQCATRQVRSGVADPCWPQSPAPSLFPPRPFQSRSPT